MIRAAAVLAVLAVSGTAGAQCRTGGYGGYAPTYHAPGYVIEPAYQPERVTQRTVVKTGDGVDVEVTSVTDVPARYYPFGYYPPPAYGYNALTVLPGVPTTKVVIVENNVGGYPVSSRTIVIPGAAKK